MWHRTHGHAAHAADARQQNNRAGTGSWSVRDRAIAHLGVAPAAAVVLAASASSAAADTSTVRAFGYFAARLTPSGGDHLAGVTDRSMLAPLLAATTATTLPCLFEWAADGQTSR
jgi:hypothetical protein